MNNNFLKACALFGTFAILNIDSHLVNNVTTTNINLLIQCWILVQYAIDVFDVFGKNKK